MYKKCCLKCCRISTLAVGHKADTKVFTTIFPLNVGFYRPTRALFQIQIGCIPRVVAFNG